MVSFLSFDEVTVSGCASRTESMHMFPAIQEDEQISGGHEFSLPVMLKGDPREASSPSLQRNVPRLNEDVTLQDSINVVDCVEFLMRFLKQHALESPCYNKIWTKKMLKKIAKEMQVLPPGNPSLINNDDDDIMSNWLFYVEELIKELKVVQSGDFHVCNSGVYVLTNTPYALILQLVAESIISGSLNG